MSNQSEELTLFKLKQCCVLPFTLKNDLIYCQRSMRDFLKVHALVSDVFQLQADADPVQMQRILNELEAEVHEINAEQQYLMLNVNKLVDKFCEHIDFSGIHNSTQVLKEHISSLIVPLVDDDNYTITPHSVRKRDTEEMLICKHFVWPREEEVTASSVQLEVVPTPLSESVLKTDASQSCSSDVAIPIVPGSVLKANQRTASLEQSLVTNESVPIEPNCVSTLDTKCIAASAAPQVNTTQCDFVAQSSLNLDQAQGRASHTKQKARRLDDEQSKKVIVTSTTPEAPQADANDWEIVEKSRINLGLTIRRIRKTMPELRQLDDDCTYEKISAASTDVDAQRKALILEKTTPSTATDDYNQKNRVHPEEYGQKAFLAMFKLYTHDMVKTMSRRKGRTLRSHTNKLKSSTQEERLQDKTMMTNERDKMDELKGSSHLAKYS